MNFILSLVLSLNVFAGDAVVGNGGNILKCSGEDEVYNNMAIDLYELEDRYHWTPYFSNSANSRESELFNALYAKLEVVHFSLAEFLALDVTQFYNVAVQVDRDLDFSDDIKGDFPPKCSPKTLIHQWVKIYGSDSFRSYREPSYIYSKELFELTPLNRLALKVHESVYTYALTGRPNLRNSDKVRKLTAYLFSKEFFNSNDPEFLQQLIDELD